MPFRRPSGKLWGETLGGGGVWSARACFVRGQVGRGAWNGRYSDCSDQKRWI